MTREEVIVAQNEQLQAVAFELLAMHQQGFINLEFWTACQDVVDLFYAKKIVYMPKEESNV